MRRMRYSLVGLMGAIALAATGCAALRFATETWAAGMFTLAVAVLLAAVLAGVLRRERARAWWCGFALFGWCYLVFTFGPWFSSNVRPFLLTSKLLAYLGPKLQQPSVVPASVVAQGWNDPAPLISSRSLQPFAFAPDGSPSSVAATPVTTWSSGLVTVASPATSDSFERVGHSLFALPVAALGGVLAGWLHARGRPGPSAAQAG